MPNTNMELDILNIRQLHDDEPMVISKINFKQLLSIYRLTERHEDLQTDFMVPTTKKSIEENFQRHLSEERLYRIEKYIKELLEDGSQPHIGVFHTALILGIDFDSDYDSNQPGGVINGSYIDSHRSKLIVPQEEGIALIIDGQHRFCGLKQYYEATNNTEHKKKIEELEFVATFLLGLDMYNLGKVFATINFNQKPVNRSLYYDIFGAMPDTERNDLKLAHDLVLHLNNSEASPIKGMVKLLGRGNGLFSQAFLVEKILPYFKSNKTFGQIYSDYLDNGTEYKRLPGFFRAYLRAIQSSFGIYWATPIQENGRSVYKSRQYSHTLCKSTGMGAFLRLIKDIYPTVEMLSEAEIERKVGSMLRQIPADSARELFSEEGEYATIAGESAQNRLYGELRALLGF